MQGINSAVRREDDEDIKTEVADDIALEERGIVHRIVEMAPKQETGEPHKHIEEVICDQSTGEGSLNRSYDPARFSAPKLVPTMLSDIGANLVVYLLALILTCLCLYRIHQVQETRELNSRLNEIQMSNENLNREWLSLTAERQTLSEHARIREAARSTLNMISPNTDAELVITLR